MGTFSDHLAMKESIECIHAKYTEKSAEHTRVTTTNY